MKLEVGMIARTNKGLLIDIIHDFDSELCAYKRDEVTKASFNLIDLIEVGDYVNGRLVVSIMYDAEDRILGIETLGCLDFENDEIKSILTHELFEANCYKVVE